MYIDNIVKEGNVMKTCCLGVKVLMQPERKCLFSQAKNHYNARQKLKDL